MKTTNIKKTTLITTASLVILIAVMLNSCIESKMVAAKGGAQLWSENCQRCHNTPSPSTFSHEQWATVGMHMQTRAQLTGKERAKIVAFLSQ